MRLSDFKGEEALDVLADIIEPITAIISDSEVQKLAKKKGVKRVEYVKPMIKNHKAELISILARLDRKTEEEYKESLSLISLPMQVLELINDPEVTSLFHSQEETKVTQLASSSPAMENTEVKGN
jgi:hypothetical protein